MADRQFSIVLRYVRRMIGGVEAALNSDGQLLARYPR